MTQPAPPPTRREIERKLSLRSAADATSLLVPQPHHALSSSPVAAPTFGSPSLGGETYTTTGTGTGTATDGAGMSEVDDLEDIGEEEEEGEEEFSEADDGIVCGRMGESDGGQPQPRVPTMRAADVEPVDEEMRRRMEGERLVKSGYLMKKGERRKTWKKRWFVLRTEKLAYYKDDKEYVLCRILNLRDIHSVLAVQLKKNQHHTIGLVTSSRTYYVRAGTAAEMEAWIRALNETRRALAERDEWAEGQEARRREAGKQGQGQNQMQAQAQTGHGLTIPERGIGHETTTLSESLSGMSLGAASGYAEPSHLADPNRAAHAHARGPVGGDFGEYGMTPVVSGLATGAGIITSSESEDDGFAHGFGVDAGSSRSGLARTIDFDARGAHQGPTSVSGLSAGSTLAASLPINASLPAAPIQTDPHKVILSGYLTKLGNKRKTWRKRWFVLTSGELVYTKSHMDTRVHRVIPLGCMLDALELDALPTPESADESSSDDGQAGTGYPIAASPGTRGQGKTRTSSHSNRSHRRFPGTHASSVTGASGSSASPLGQWQHTFQVITPKRTFKLCAPTEEEEIKWLAALRALINRERGVMSPGAAPFAGGMASGMGSYGNTRQSSLPPAVGITRASPPSTSIDIPPATAPVVMGSPITAAPAYEASSLPSNHAHRLPADQASYFPPQASQAGFATSPSYGTLISTKQAATPNLPPLVTTHHSPRNRSATQSAKAAVAEVVRRFHPETSHHSHSHSHNQAHSQTPS